MRIVTSYRTPYNSNSLNRFVIRRSITLVDGEHAEKSNSSLSAGNFTSIKVAIS